jgi:hypothetical protein
MVVVPLTHYCAGYKIEKNKMGGACSAYGGGFLVGKLRERDHWKDSDVDGKIILRRIFRKWNVRVRTGLRWLRIETGSRHL